MSNSILTETTTSRLLTPTGQTALPTSVLSSEAAHIMRSYFHWALKHGLEPELYCASCFNGSRDDKATYDISEMQIGIVCRCSLRFFRGLMPPLAPVAPSVSVPRDDGGVVRVELSADAAKLLRHYKKVLLELGLKEALRCNVCYDFDPGSDGVHAEVLTNTIRMKCRCSDRVYTGMTM